ncbi:MAG: RNA polymerase sigma factor (TIGR02999 family) [Planctomycetota bacterium]
MSNDPGAANQLFDRLYPELHKLARARMRNQPAGLTLETTGLVHEAYLRLMTGAKGDWEGRRAFFAHAAKVMRSVLIDNARRRASDKRDAGRRTTLTCFSTTKLAGNCYDPKIDRSAMCTLDKAAQLGSV